MAKYHGKIGYVKTIETEPGIWEESVTERKYGGDIVSRRISVEQGDKINPDITLSKTISIVADPYAIENYGYIRYVEYLGTNWCVTSVDPQIPRLILSTGGKYNGNTPGTSN